MEASKSLRRPANWQDFETLCLNLWGELWNCPNEIKKNGRSGQAQSGVDICGIPFDEDGYYGIQCKGKDEYKNEQFSDKEILAEIEKAKLFEPVLKKLYFATTAQKDVKTEAFIRLKNLEHRKAGLFEVHLYSWEDIVDLIDRTKHTKDWYLKGQGYKTNHSVAITFEDGSTETTLSPKFCKKRTNYRMKDERDEINAAFSANYGLGKMLSLANMFERSQSDPFGAKISLSYSMIKILIRNTGTDPIEKYKVSLQFDGEIQDLSTSNIVEESVISIPGLRIPDTFLYKETLTGKIVPNPLNSVLVGDDTFVSDKIFIKPYPKDSQIVIRWKLISSNYKDEGVLTINMKPDVERKYESIIVEEREEVKTIEGEIEDCLDLLKNHK